MHIATCGQTGFQRMLYMARKKNSRTKVVREWKISDGKRPSGKCFIFDRNSDNTELERMPHQYRIKCVSLIYWSFLSHIKKDTINHFCIL